MATEPLVAVRQYDKLTVVNRIAGFLSSKKSEHATNFSVARDGYRQNYWPNGFSNDGLCAVNSSAPFSVMCIKSSSRIPNLPRI